MFFVATAPESTDDHVNVSPKGSTRSAVLGPHTVAYLDLTGSGVETIAHLRENGRITLMFCAFHGQAATSSGSRARARRARPAIPAPSALLARFPDLPGARAVIVVDVDAHLDVVRLRACR